MISEKSKIIIVGFNNFNEQDKKDAENAKAAFVQDMQRREASVGRSLSEDDTYLVYYTPARKDLCSV